jgi:hypothetical protein
MFHEHTPGVTMRQVSAGNRVIDNLTPSELNHLRLWYPDLDFNRDAPYSVKLDVWITLKVNTGSASLHGSPFRMSEIFGVERTYRS